jgi:hypothetical protein
VGREAIGVDEAQGKCVSRPGAARAVDEIFVALAGGAAELEILNGVDDHRSWRDDRRDARRAARRLAPGDRWAACMLYHEQMARGCDFFREPFAVDAVKRIAGWLAADGELCGRRCRELYLGAIEDDAEIWGR